jgi:hypothetical protein
MVESDTGGEDTPNKGDEEEEEEEEEEEGGGGGGGGGGEDDSYSDRLVRDIGDDLPELGAVLEVLPALEVNAGTSAGEAENFSYAAEEEEEAEEAAISGGRNGHASPSFDTSLLAQWFIDVAFQHALLAQGFIAVAFQHAELRETDPRDALDDIERGIQQGLAPRPDANNPRSTVHTNRRLSNQSRKGKKYKKKKKKEDKQEVSEGFTVCLQQQRP